MAFDFPRYVLTIPNIGDPIKDKIVGMDVVVAVRTKKNFQKIVY
jgi:hypothetical protein